MKALAMSSGGLDSQLAIKLLLEQGIEVEGITFSSPFFGNKRAVEGAKQLRIKLKTVKLGSNYVSMVRKPKHGHGSAINPCKDCKIFMLKKAKKYAEKIGAKFIITGEVLDQRPMSQYYGALMTIAKESGLEGKLLRPLSAKLLPETEAEKKGFVSREKLLAIKGRSRKEQMELAKKFKLKYPSPAGGCLLCEKEFAIKLRDLFKHEEFSLKEINLLKFGRHFRFSENKIVVGRNKEDNERILSLKGPNDYYFEVPEVGSPITLLQGKKTKEAIKITASLTARYSDNKDKVVLVRYGNGKLNKEIKVKQSTEEEIKDLRVE
jgi:tRNA U34 2-thiouridine synthase MnmA/TrmU